MIIGVDFDNTIVSYDAVFPKLAVEFGLMQPGDAFGKTALRDFLRAAGREDEWTELQGRVYGERMADAQPFPGVLDFFAQCRSRGVAAQIISHRTEYPYRGPRFNLHDAARAWLDRNFPQHAGEIFFEFTKENKLARIESAGCTHFVDDLPELLAEAAFPAGAEPLLFDPKGDHAAAPFRRFASWREISEYFFGKEIPHDR